MRKEAPSGGGVDRVRKLSIAVAAIASTLVKAPAASAESVRAGVDEDPYKVRAVRWMR